MTLTAADARAINQACLANRQEFFDAVLPRGHAGSIPRDLNPNTTRRLNHFRLMDTYDCGAWAEMSGGAYVADDCKIDMIGCVVWLAQLEDEPDGRQRASAALSDWLETVAPPAPPFLRPARPTNEVERPPAKVRPVRNLRRG
jgi:hypothetical protein